MSNENQSAFVKYVMNREKLRFAVLLICYSAIAVLALGAALALRFDFSWSAFQEIITFGVWNLVVLVTAIKLFFLLCSRQMSGLLSYFSTPDLYRLVLGMGLASGSLLALQVSGVSGFLIPRGVILLDFVLSLFGYSAFRLGCRILRERYLKGDGSQIEYKSARRVAIIGAGDVAANFIKEIKTKRGLGMIPVACYDDDKGKWGRRIHDVSVVGAPETLAENKTELGIEEVVIAMPSASARRIGELVKFLQKQHLRFATVPGLDQLATGQVRVTQIRPVEIRDLLGRPAVELEKEDIRHYLSGQRVIVTGAGGSIGSELCRQIATYNPETLLLIERCEVQMFRIEQELIDAGYRGVVRPLVADVLDDKRMRYIFERFRPNVVFHAAAHKHVPLMESQPSEAIQNNSIGVAKVAELARETRCDRFVFISTDKAINPTNVMGASKRLGEIYLQALNAEEGNTTKFMAVRFGNVLGSSGSVIPTFKKQIAEGGPVRVTHPEVTRYFMTIPEASGLVIQSGAIGEGGEIFVLDMGEPMKIIDLARQLIELSGLEPERDIAIEIIGLRPGEKLYEELQHTGENMESTTHSKIFRFISSPETIESMRERLDVLKQVLFVEDVEQLKSRLAKEVPEYTPYLE